MRLLLLLPARDEPRYASFASQLVEPMVRPLKGQGIEVETAPWTEVGDFADFDAVTPLLAWSYHEREAQWRILLERLAESGVGVVNSLGALAWNTRKTYLAEIEAAGAPVVPTLFVDRLTPAAIAEAHDRFGPEIIAKPQVSAGSSGTIRVSVGSGLEGGPSGPAMLQPFLPAVAEEGELSLLYFGGVFSHAIGKVASPGDFRVQIQYGGAYSAIEATPEMIKAAGEVIDAAGRPLTYARIDLIRDTEGVLRLMELEAIEPDLYLGHAPDGGAAFAKAVRAAMG
ncbi:MAG TPA: transporter [Caulobacteraceae bacterium]|jgi:glutathione synthase/RimK-type ligase-like ATP-grasp enzyme